MTPPSTVDDLLALFDEAFIRVLVRRLQAALTHDTGFSMVPAPGLRTSATATRQLLYSSGGIDIDLHVQLADTVGGPGWRVSGQLLGPVGAGQATLQCGNWSASSGWNDLCEFSFAPVPDGPCRLLLQGGGFALLYDADIQPVIQIEGKAVRAHRRTA